MRPRSLKAKVYGRGAALCVEAVATEDGEPTVNLEVAPKGRDGAVAWGSKIVVQASASELVLLAGIGLGLLPELSLKRPGKGIDLERQAGHLFVRATAGQGVIYALPLVPGDAFYVGAVILQQLSLRAGGLAPELIIAQVRGACALRPLPGS